MKTNAKISSSNPANDDAVAVAVADVPAATARIKHRSEEKWSAPVMQLGYTPLPSLLLRAQGKLGLEPDQMMTLLQIVEHWWKADEMPFPSKETISRRILRSPRSVQRYLTDLEKLGYIKRVGRFNGYKTQVSNYYSLDGLVAKLKEIEPEFTKAAKANRARLKKVETAKGA